MSEPRVTFTLTREVDGLTTTYTTTLSPHVAWPTLVDDAILPGLRALGYMVDVDDLHA